MSGSTCSCNAGYDKNPSTGNSCSKLDEANQAKGPQQCPTCAGDPIYPLTGAQRLHVRTGLKLRGVELVLTYDSSDGQRPYSPDNATMLVEPNSFGPLWHSSYHHKLQVSPTKKSALLSRGNSQALSFTGDGSGSFSSTGYNAGALAIISGGYRYTDTVSGDIETFDSAGTLTSLARADGAVLTFSYTNGNLTQVTADDGRAVRFAYANNQVTKITGPDWQAITIGYDTNKNFTSLTWPDNTVRTFAYENTSLPWALTGVLDENNARHATFAYDDDGRAVSTEQGLGVNKYTVSYAAPPKWATTDSYDAATDTISRVHAWLMPTGTTLSTPAGQSVALEATTVHGQPSVASSSQPAGSGSTPAATASTYDAAGNLASRDDAAGTRTCYVYDGSRRETVRVEGLATTVDCSSVTPAGSSLPAGARKVLTSWHPDWKLPVTITEPLKKTTMVYHGQPDPFNANATASCTSAPNRADGRPVPLVCKQVEQALLPVSGGPSGPVDPYFDKVVLLLHADGTNGSTSIVDSSAQHQTIPAAGNTVISTAQSKFGGSSMAFDGADDYVGPLPNAAALDYGTGDFTIEGWFYLSSAGSGYRYIFNQHWGSANVSVRFGNDGFGDRLQFGINDTTLAGVYSSAYAQSSLAGAWHHVALTRSAGVVRAFLDGSLLTLRNNNYAGPDLTSWTDTSSISGTTSASVSAGTVYSWLGYIDDFRITKGVARYTANFTPPSAQFPDTGPDMNAVGHTAGDLQTVTNAAGQVAQYTLYDPAGRVRQMVDPKGITTDIAYTPRGWVSTVSVTPPGGSARTTSYTHDGVGQMARVALPDGTSLAYSYDAAHRLTGVTDTQGNSVTYTLDAEGNRVGEDLRDAGGALRRSIARSFDALNRLQQVTGAAQ